MSDFNLNELNAKQPRPNRGLVVLVVFIGLLVVFMIANPILLVGAGKRAVLFSLTGGTLPRELGEGMHLIIPFVQKAKLYDVRVRTYTMSGLHSEGDVQGDDSMKALTSDGQEVTVDLSVRFHPDPPKVWKLHQNIGLLYVSKIIRPEIRSQTRVVIAQYPVEQVYSSKREAIQTEISELLKASLGKNNIVVEEVLLRNIQFSPDYALAVERKQIAEQDAKRMIHVLDKAKLEKEEKILIAQGDARSIELRGEAIAQNARVVQYEYARKLGPNVAAIITDGKNITVPFSTR